MSDDPIAPPGPPPPQGPPSTTAGGLPPGGAADGRNTARGAHARDLTPTQRAAVEGLARWPFISAQDLRLGLDEPALGTVYRALAQLQTRSLVEWAPYVSSRAQHERLWYLTDAGVRLAARLAEADPPSFARAWGLGEAALTRRLGRLEHLTLSRGFLLDLQAACRERHPSASGPLLTTWRPWPVSLTYPWGRRRAVCLLDGAATLTWAGDDGPPRDAHIVVVWDDGAGLALEAVRPRLVALLRARVARDRAAVRAAAGQSSAGGAQRGFPTVLLVATRPERARGAWSLAQEVARRECMHPLPLLVTSAQTLRAAGPVEALWQAQDGLVGPLATLLASRATGRGAVPPARPRHGAPTTSAVDRPDQGRTRDRLLVQGQFARRSQEVLATLTTIRLEWQDAEKADAGATASQGSGNVSSGSVSTMEAGDAAVTSVRLSRAEYALIALALRPADQRLLHCLGLVPLAAHETLATLTGDGVWPTSSPRRGWATPRSLSRLLQWGLCDHDLPGHVAAQAYRRYFLTPRGLAVLAVTAGVSPVAYSQLTGAIAGSRLPAPRQDRGRPRQADPQPRDVRLGSYQLAYYRRYAEHTESVQAVFIAFVQAARAALEAGEDHALETWRFEWAALRRYPHNERRRTPRPDAYGRYRVGGQALAFFLEIDRGTSGLRDWASKLVAYGAYRDSGLHSRDPAHGEPAYPLLLVVTTGEERLRHILALGPQVATARLTRPLDMWVTTAADLAAQGPLGPIWRAAAWRPPHPLWPDASGGAGGVGR